MTFYGFKSKEDEKKFALALEMCQSVFSGYYMNDMLCTFDRCLSFAKDDPFTEAFFRNASNDFERSRMWRLHVLTWAAAYAGSLPEGDFVECGVLNGFSSAVVLDYLKDDQGYDFHLFDTFEGIPDKYSTESERKTLNEYYGKETMPDLVEFVRDRFSDYPNVFIHQGTLPDSLKKVHIKKVRLLHMDMNVAEAESLTLEALWDRVVPGGIIVLDDYGHAVYDRLHLADKAVVEKHGHKALELPTGQGFIIKGPDDA